jgi:hypothetical protein
MQQVVNKSSRTHGGAGRVVSAVDACEAAAPEGEGVWERRPAAAAAVEVVEAASTAAAAAG